MSNPTTKPIADMTAADIAAHGIPLAVVAQRKVEAATAKRQQALRADQWTVANWHQKEADVWQEVLDVLGAQAEALRTRIADLEYLRRGAMARSTASRSLPTAESYRWRAVGLQDALDVIVAKDGA